MEYCLLVDKQDAIPTVARWYYDEWGHKITDNSFEKTCERIKGKLNRDMAPLHVLAIGRGKVLGVAQLKIREMNIYPNREYWLGSVFVPPENRGVGIASGIAEHVSGIAKSFGADKISLQTEQLDGGLYGRLGWTAMEQVHYQGLDVLVMERAL